MEPQNTQNTQIETRQDGVNLSYVRFLAGQHEIQRTQRVRDYACGKICHKLVLHNILTWHDILTFSDDTVNKMG
jgi:hypothetical protein